MQSAAALMWGASVTRRVIRAPHSMWGALRLLFDLKAPK